MAKIWFVLKQMGLRQGGAPVGIDTANSTPALKRLFDCGSPDGQFYVPLAATKRYRKMESDASRSIIQTTIKRWQESGSVVTVDPSDYLDFSNDGGELTVTTGRKYPLGLGFGQNGFANGENQRVSIPRTAFAVWYGRKTQIPDGMDPSKFLWQSVLDGLGISPTEESLMFVDDELEVATANSVLPDSTIYQLCKPYIDGNPESTVEVVTETFSDYSRRVKSMVSGLEQPTWMRSTPDEELKTLIETGQRAILLYGPPRTGKTRGIDKIVPKNSADRATIQIHDGWGYDHLVEGFKPDEDGNWKWIAGPLKSAIESKKKYIVLEEINRTSITTSLGEIFSLIENAYRGKDHAITLRSGEKFWIPAETVFFMTMNTVDKSTEDVDDALLGRVAGVEFPPRPEDLNSLLAAKGIDGAVRTALGNVFVEVQSSYPLGHGYFADLPSNAKPKDIITYYKGRIRPVLFNYLGQLRQEELSKIDNLIDQSFGK